MPSYKLFCSTFIVFLPVIYIISLIIAIYSSYVKDYIFPLLNNYTIKEAKEFYPFFHTSSKESSHTKGMVLLVFVTYHLVLLLISLLRTIFVDPGYFPNVNDFEIEVVKKQIGGSNTTPNPNMENFKNFKNLFTSRSFKSEEAQEIEDSGTIIIKDSETPEKRQSNTLLQYNSDQTYHIAKLESDMLQGPLNNTENMKFRELLNALTGDHREKRDDVSVVLSRNKNSLSLLNSDRDIMDIYLRTEDPKNFNPDDVLENFQTLDLFYSTLCNTCLRIKVERSHHCRQCGRCVLKMDHHCPWLANCIGFRNYKYFCLVHLYGVIATFTISCTFWEAIAGTFLQKEIPILNSGFILYAYFSNMGLMFFLSWLFYCNANLVFKGQTVIEQSDRERFPNCKIKSNYNLGCYKNFIAIFGKNPLFWFLPIFPNYDGEGLSFERNDGK